MSLAVSAETKHKKIQFSRHDFDLSTNEEHRHRCPVILILALRLFREFAQPRIANLSQDLVSKQSSEQPSVDCLIDVLISLSFQCAGNRNAEAMPGPLKVAAQTQPGQMTHTCSSG